MQKWARRNSRHVSPGPSVQRYFNGYKVTYGDCSKTYIRTSGSAHVLSICKMYQFHNMQVRRRAVLVYMYLITTSRLLPPSCDSIQCFVRSILSVSECRCEELNFLRIFEDQQIGMLLRRFYAVWQVDGVFVEVNAH